MDNKKLKNEGDEFSVINFPGIARRISEQKERDENYDKIKPSEDRILIEVKKSNHELQNWIKWLVIIAAPLLLVLILINTEQGALRHWLITFVLIGALILYIKYDSLKRRNILRCKSCGEEFVPKENDSDKKCPYCKGGNSVEYL
ncbi:MAG: hypothetical protein WC446_02650 [Candidatus Paceibacterota bacterium]|jgi:hypothetical protein